MGPSCFDAVRGKRRGVIQNDEREKQIYFMANTEVGLITSVLLQRTRDSPQASSQLLTYGERHGDE